MGLPFLWMLPSSLPVISMIRGCQIYGSSRSSILPWLLFFNGPARDHSFFVGRPLLYVMNDCRFKCIWHAVLGSGRLAFLSLIFPFIFYFGLRYAISTGLQMSRRPGNYSPPPQDTCFLEKTFCLDLENKCLMDVESKGPFL